MSLRRQPMILAFSFVALIGLWGLSGLASASDAPPRPQKLGVIYPGPHPLVTDVMTGLREGLRVEGLVEGKDYEIDERHASGDQTYALIAQQAIAAGATILVPIATPTAQAAAKENDGRLPLVFIAVTDPVGALLVRNMTAPGDNITGVSDAWPYRQQLALLHAILPKAKRIGVMYNPSEQNSDYGIRQIRTIAIDLGLTIVEGTVSGESEISARANSLISVDKVDAIYLSSDNTILGAAEAAIKAGLDHGIPVFSGDSGTVQKGAVASASIGYVGVGRLAGSLVARVIHGAKPGTLPVVVATGDDIYLNLDSARRMNVQIPPDIRAQAKQVFGTDAGRPPARSAWLIAAIGVLALSAIIVYVFLRRKLRAGLKKA